MHHKDAVALLSAVESGPNKQENKRILCNHLVQKKDGKGYRIDMENPYVVEVNKRLKVDFKQSEDMGMPELVYIAKVFNGNRELWEEAITPII